LEGQITIVVVATRHEKNRRNRRELPVDTDLTRDFSAVAPSTRQRSNSGSVAFSAAKTAQLQA
jgi:hypothetical protein